MSKPFLTILTATWNRAGLLLRLYQSISENCPNNGSIEWCIIDDGSSDNTRDLVTHFQSESNFPIRYHYVAHGGKHRAINTGFRRARGEWIIIIDSDDWFLDGGIDACLAEIIKADNHGAKAAFLPMHVAGHDRQWRFNHPGICRSFLDRVNHERWFDCSFVFSRDVGQFRFPEIAGETFMAESAFLAQLGPDIGFFLSDQVCVGVEYQADGLSLTSIPTRMASPVGCTLTCQLMLSKSLRPRIYFRTLANFGRFWWHSVFRKSPVRAPETISQYAVLPAGLMFALADFWRSRKFRR
ncbi:glycosyltransferase family 2 protein [Pontixanthobacter sp.]|uniref:glycosyltransferase family 2 protein n=1 Tax=Pontixanthobacter sp. TaxID=2792078 RepID=UPI003C7BC250